MCPVDTTSMQQRYRNAMGLVTVAVVSGLTVTTLAAPPASYYNTVDETNSSTLRATLHNVIDDHQRYPYTSSGTDTWDVLEDAQQDPNNGSRIIDVYENASFTKQGGGNTYYNREHSWPKSYGFPNDGGTNYPYTDCHQLWLCSDSYNSERSNKPFRTCSAGCSEWTTDYNNGEGGGSGTYPGHSNWTSGDYTDGTWEVWDGRRGDIARSMFYMDIRYEGGTHGGTGAWEPNLILTNSETLIDNSNTGSNESVAYMGMLSVLLQWHLDDPVDDYERDRNDAVYNYQGNRNPFIDHPEWVDCLYNGNCGGTGCSGDAECDDGLYCNGAETCVATVCQPGSDPCPGQGCNEATDSCATLPTGSPWINEFHYDNDGTDTGEFVEIAGPAGVSLSGWQVVGYNGNGGATYNTIDLSGTIPEQQGCMGTLSFSFSGMQNGAPDALALVDDLGDVVEFLSYEGVMTGAGGPASGMQSVDCGVEETNSTPVGYSLQLSGTGAQSTDFSWQAPAIDTPGQPNNGQTFEGCSGCSVPADCDDGLWCNGAEDCVDGDCVSGTAPDCDDGVACTDDACNESTDSCDYVANNANCDDGQYCNGVEICDSESGCLAGTDPCVGFAGCDEANDECLGCQGDEDCDDGLYCNGVETCVGMACQPGTPPDCDDAVDCTDDSCNEVTDGCDHTANHALCDDGLYCNGSETCDVAVGCLPGTTIDCGDGVSCTDDSCNEATDGCDHIVNDAHCDDGLWCTGVETCDAISDCQPGTPLDCDDEIDCTIDTCNEVTHMCASTADDALCDDGLWCNGAEVCLERDGCQLGAPRTCDDGVTCTIDSCNETTDTCDHTPDDGACDDDLWCNGTEYCDPEVDCQFSATPACSDGIDCTIDVCDELSDTCSYVPSDGYCDDGNLCNGTETCDILGGCQSGSPLVCDDDDLCTTDSCAPATGCVFDPIDCSDDLLCTEDICTDGVCSHPPVTCPGEQLCDPTDGVCKECLGDQHCPDDGLWCTGTEVCVEGACTHEDEPCDPAQQCVEAQQTCLNGIPCTTHSECVVANNNCCEWDQCGTLVLGLCDPAIPMMYGDVTGALIGAPPNGTVNLTDVLCALDAFGLGNLENCANADIAILGAEDCPQGNGVVNLSDILKLLDTFGAPATPGTVFMCTCPMNP